MKYLLLLCILVGSCDINGQETIPHEYFVEWRQPKAHLNSFIANCKLNHIEIQYLDSYQPFGIITFPATFQREDEIKLLTNESSIKHFHASKVLQARGCSPNDPSYNRQWNMGKMEFDEVWCYTNEGISPLGDTLVIGLMDFGFDFRLNDILPNVFVNHHELPNNKIDDDGNGYVDDYYGYSPISINKNDEHPEANHGTEVISILGAKGNNGKDITGAAQNIKILMCSGMSESHMIACYTYFYKMKELYLQSGGQKGAYVVATSISLGFNSAFPEDHPNVCPLYDWLGSIGIMNVCATVNEPDHDIGLKGDIPSLCPSDFLIAVTNTDMNDRFVPSSGYSKLHIDIGASGEEVAVLQRGGMLGSSSGCSLSAPQVGAGIVLLNQFCGKYAQLLKNKPEDALKLLKSMILNCGDPLSSLSNITVSGNRFNVFKSMLCLETYCNSLKEQSFMEIEVNPLKDGNLKVNLGFDQFGPYTLRIFNPLGQMIDFLDENHRPGSVDQTIERDVSNYPSGIYYIQFLFNGKQETKGFVKY
ncbi:MAG: S8 family peptidase [Saprospiraceae bacterium]|nr:S8 family peptidase [Saprospiraceae bacterium]